uniref:Uncharacterized protein n=1 Tax=Setaria digitata TaxID=48799 RepID=A0A915PIM4_9BILA
MGGVLEETWCSFGGRKFTCLYLTENLLFEALREADLLVDDEESLIYYCSQDEMHDSSDVNHVKL